MSERMFCYQCEQTANGKGCTQIGVCGKSPEVAALQDLLIYSLKGLSQVALEARKREITDEKADIFTCKALFATLTNVNFDPDRVIELINETVQLRDSLRRKVEAAGGTIKSAGPVSFMPKDSVSDLVEQGRLVGIKSDPTLDPDIHSLQWILTYGIKGVAAYADHAYILGQKDTKVFAFIQPVLELLQQRTRKQVRKGGAHLPMPVVARMMVLRQHPLCDFVVP